jgi:ABC-2 type transport system ATP-binding protein
VSQQGNILNLAFAPGQITSTDLISRISSRYEVVDLFIENPPIGELIAQLDANTDLLVGHA